MPPKKGKSKATPAKQAAREPPATVTSNRGKEFATTAAAARPRRDTTATSTAAQNETTTATPSKKRGRPAKVTETEDEPPKKRGRPAKKQVAAAAKVVAPPKKKVGRPAKVKPAAKEGDEDEDDADADAEVEEAPPKKKPGRPAKAKAAPAADEPAEPKKRGRPANQASSRCTLDESDALPKQRGRPPYGGETTKNPGDIGAAAEQLEEELVDTTEAQVQVPASKRKASGKASSKKTNAAQGDEDDENAAVDEQTGETELATGKQYWLMKAEQESRPVTLQSGREFDAKFTIDDLRAKSEPEAWDGVRNPQAAKNMRTMKVGDLCFFYASNGKKPGITGIMEIVKEHEPDQTVHDEDSYGYVKKEADRQKWCVVHVEFRKKLAQPVYLSELQKFTKGNGVLSGMQVLTSTRLSVSHVTEKEWNFITENLIDGYEDGEAQPSGSTSAAAAGDEDMVNGTDEGAVMDNDKFIANSSPPVAPAQIADKMNLDLFNGNAPAMALPSIESDLLMTDTNLQLATFATSRVGSRASSRAASRQASLAPSVSSAIGAAAKANGIVSRPVSRANSLAPPVANTSRGRSRTPKPCAGSVQPGTITQPAGMLTIDE